LLPDFLRADDIFKSWEDFLINRGWRAIEPYYSALWPIASHSNSDSRSYWGFYRYEKFDVALRVRILLDGLSCTVGFSVKYGQHPKINWMVNKRGVEDTGLFFEAVKNPQLWPLLISVGWAQPIATIKLQEIS
jgi:hypothetical protein